MGEFIYEHEDASTLAAAEHMEAELHAEAEDPTQPTYVELALCRLQFLRKWNPLYLRAAVHGESRRLLDTIWPDA